jgi:hypothetical protein
MEIGPQKRAFINNEIGKRVLHYIEHKIPKAFFEVYHIKKKEQ